MLKNKPAGEQEKHELFNPVSGAQESLTVTLFHQATQSESSLLHFISQQSNIRECIHTYILTHIHIHAHIDTYTHI